MLRAACAYAQSDQSLCWSLEYLMTVKLLTEQHLEFLSLKGGCAGSAESTLVIMLHCWKSRVTAHLVSASHLDYAAVRLCVLMYDSLGSWKFVLIRESCPMRQNSNDFGRRASFISPLIKVTVL